MCFLKKGSVKPIFFYFVELYLIDLSTKFLIICGVEKTLNLPVLLGQLLNIFFGSQVRRGNHQQEEEGGKEESKTMEKGMKNILIPLCQSQIQDLFL